MKNMIISLLLAVLVLACVNAVVSKNTVITGTVWNQGKTVKVGGANVIVVCNSIVKTGVTSSTGVFAVGYNASEGCNKDLTSSIIAYTSNRTGSESVIVHDFGGTVNLGIASISLSN